MEPANNYLEINKASWNKRVEPHLKSAFYDVEGFIKGGTSLNSIELEILGNVEGKSILHLQCHFGQDTISLGRMGAQVTGVDLSDKAIESAVTLSKQTNVPATFICSDLYDLPNHLTETFDIVFTSYGTIGWLPDMDKWARIVSRYLKLGGTFVFAEFHPVIWMFDDDFKKIAYAYTNTGAILETETGTYADRDANIGLKSVVWNHGLAEVISALLKHGLELTSFKEYDYSPYNCFNHTIEFEPGKFRIKNLDNKMPMVYSLSAKKND